MSLYAINGVRIDPETGRVTHVRWAQVDPKRNAWVRDPYVEEVISVVDAITGGDDVCTLFPVEDRTVPGPKVKVVVYAGGLEGIDVVDPKEDGRTLADLPAV